MSEGKEVLRLILSNWKTLSRWALRVPAQPEITVDELAEQLESGNPPLLVDVRSMDEYQGTDETYKYGHIPNAILVPILEIESRLDELEQYKDREIVTICPGGGRSLVAVDVLNDVGFKKVRSLKGSTDAWHKKGYPMVTDDSPS